jgi:hypothetical protein
VDLPDHLHLLDLLDRLLQPDLLHLLDLYHQ